MSKDIQKIKRFRFLLLFSRSSLYMHFLHQMKKVLKKWWWSVVIWWFAKNFNIHLRSLCIYFLSNCNTKCNKRKRKTREEGYNTIDAQYFVTNLHKITCMLQLFFACLLPTECAYNLHWSGRLRVYVGMVVVDECFRS